MITSFLEPTHLAVILAVALLLLGPRRLPAAGRALGSGISNFKHALAHPDDLGQGAGAAANGTTGEHATPPTARRANGSSLS